MGPIPQDDTIPVQLSDTVTRGTITPTYPVLQYPHRPGGGDAIADGFVYRGKQIPALKDKFVFGDITVGRILYAERAELLAADDVTRRRWRRSTRSTRASRPVEQAYRARGGKGADLPGAARSPAAGAWTCGSRSMTPASSTS